MTKSALLAPVALATAGMYFNWPWVVVFAIIWLWNEIE